MSADYDVVTIGAGGSNSLVAAAYLAAAGKKVLVLERNDYPGGGVATFEVEPGFLSERHSAVHGMVLANPLIANDELGLLSRYGLEYIHLDPLFGTVFEDDSYVAIYRDKERTMEEFAKFSQHDAEAWGRFVDLATPLGAAILGSFFEPPTIVPATDPAILDFMVTAGKSVTDVLTEWFTDERILITLLRFISEANNLHPDDKNTGATALMGLGLLGQIGMAVPKGGGSEFTNALVRCIEDHGGEVRLSTEVNKVLVENGRAIGVSTTSGDTIRAKDAVLACIHPHLLDRFVDDLDPGLVRAAHNYKITTLSGFTIHAALNEPLTFKGGPEVDALGMNALVGLSLDDMFRDFDDLSRGRLSRKPMLGAGCTSIVDPSRAPEGNATLHVFSLTTHNLADGGPARWNDIKQSFTDSCVERIGEFVTNLTPDNIRAIEALSPLDHAIDSPSFQGGDIFGGAMHAHQSGAMRPTPALAQYRVPGVAGLYLTGPFMHPGGGMTGGGRATAVRMFEDLGMDFGQFTGGTVAADRVGMA